MALQQVNTQPLLQWAEAVTVTSVRNAGNVSASLNGGVYQVGVKEAARSNGVYQQGDIQVTLGVADLTGASLGTIKPRDTVVWGGSTYTVIDAGGSTWMGFQEITARNPVIAGQLQQTATLNRDTSTPGTGGIRVPSWSAYATAVPCRLQELDRSSENNEDLGGRVVRIKYALYLSAQQTVQAGDQVVVASGPTVTIVGSEGTDGLGILQTVRCEGFG